MWSDSDHQQVLVRQSERKLQQFGESALRLLTVFARREDLRCAEAGVADCVGCPEVLGWAVSFDANVSGSKRKVRKVARRRADFFETR